jgi:hypothetical protein
MNAKAEENRAYVRKLLREKEIPLARALYQVMLEFDLEETRVARRMARLPERRAAVKAMNQGIVGFGELDFEHGAKFPHLGSDEVT